MKQMTSAEIRKMWLEFWQEKGHGEELSASLVPIDDPTLLWINSGVATLKKYFDGSIVPENLRITNSQKSIRTNDIENVGITARHHTLFEMLGNFSIGDYFKVEVIPWAWELLTDEKWFALDPEKLYITYYTEDTETRDIWLKTTGLSENHFIAMDENFWDLGAGPCGPDTEIFYDRGEKFQDLPDENPEMFPGGENERYLEIWNIVFSQFNHMPDGSYEPLKHKNVDTGMGLERVTSVFQDTPTNFETDLFMPIIKEVEALTADIKYGDSPASDVSFKVIADHVRAVSFAIGDRALPSNEGRGYILRRLIRRAVMHGRRLGINKQFLSGLVPTIAKIMASYYPEIGQDLDFIQQVITTEENRFMETIEDGEVILQEKIAGLKTEGKTELAGVDAFKLYDTYGFPLELTAEYLEDVNFTVDQSGFETAMEEQRERARAARKQADGMAIQSSLLGDINVDSEFIGYDDIQTDAVINYLITDNISVKTVKSDQVAYLTATKTPFYAEMGGQVADTGEILTTAGEVLGRIVDVKRAPNGQHVHEVETVATINLNQKIVLAVDKNRRQAITKNHTATHLLHQALKEVLGEHANQAGSLVSPEHLRFDFSHFGEITADQLQEMEDIVNEKIWDGLVVETTETTIDKAKEHGAMALFGEKYGSDVRMVDIAGWSIELCGGIHVRNTQEIGLFKVLSESGIGAGIRRIEAVTSKEAVQYYQLKANLLTQIKAELKVAKDDNIMHRLEQVQTEAKELKQSLESYRAKENQAAAGEVFKNVQTAGDITFITAHVENRGMDDLRNIADEWKQAEYSDVLVLATSADDKANLLVAVKADAVKQGIKAGNIIKKIAPEINGGGGGRPDMAQAGGKNPAGIPAALEKVASLLII